MIKQVNLQYIYGGNLYNPYSIQLGSPDGTFGIKNLNTGQVIVPNNTSVTNTSLGVFVYDFNATPNVVYQVSWAYEQAAGAPVSYITQTIGPFVDTTSGIRAVNSVRGRGIQGARTTLFIKITDIAGKSQDPTNISYTITDSSANIITSGNPEKISSGYFALDWDIPFGQAEGDYTITWLYTVDGIQSSLLQILAVANAVNQINPPSLYNSRISEFRFSLDVMLKGAQAIPVYRETARKSSDLQTFHLTFKNWNPCCRIYLDKEIVTSGITVDYFNGCVTFDEPITSYETVEADYNFRWFSDIELDVCLSNAVALVNLYPPASLNATLINLPDRYIPLVLYAAAVDAIRNMMMSLLFQEPQYVFGGPQGAEKAYANLEGLKQNYEKTLTAALEQKKNGPYVGLTKTIVTPEFALPGGRSRWFRYLFSNTSG